MTTASTRSTPATGPTRFARGRADLPNDPGLDSLLADKRIGSTAKAIVLAIVRNWAWYKPSCFPSDFTIAAKIGKSTGHVQRCLKQLEDAGWIRREHTHAVRSGRLIWLLWRCPEGRNGAQSSPTPARGQEAAPARSEQVVTVEQEEFEQAAQPETERQRPASPSPAISIAVALEQVVKAVRMGDEISPTSVESTPSPTPPIPTQPQELTKALPALVSELLPDDPAVAVTNETVPSPAVVVLAPTKQPPSTDGLFAVLSPAEQSRFWELDEATQTRILTWLGLGDRICLNEARRLLKPLPPPEPPSSSIPTIDLLKGLPGRSDRLAAVAGRLTAELQDPKSYSYYLSVAEAVCFRRQPSTALVSAWRQGTNPKAERPGAVFAYAWKRETSSG